MFSVENAVMALTPELTSEFMLTKIRYAMSKAIGRDFRFRIDKATVCFGRIVNVKHVGWTKPIHGKRRAVFDVEMTAGSTSTRVVRTEELPGFVKE